MPRRTRNGRRSISVFSLSFLDAMTCGLGAVILLYLVLNANAARQRDYATHDRRAEATRLERVVLDETRELVTLRNTLERIIEESRQHQGLATRLLAQLEEIRRELATLDADTISRSAHINRLLADVQSLEEESKRLSALAPSEEVPGDRVRSFVGDGDRQYLTGLRVTGSRVLILVDASASMLGTTIVDVLRTRNLPDDDKRNAPKWKHALATVDWLTTQLPRDAQFQIYTFNETAKPAIADTGGRWITANREMLNKAIWQLRTVTPENGTSLYNAFDVSQTLSPPPDNVILLADGLPTMGAGASRRAFVSEKTRQKLFVESVGQLQSGVPLQVILFPMEGDPHAASAFWRLTQATQGSFLTPTRDWP